MRRWKQWLACTKSAMRISPLSLIIGAAAGAVAVVASAIVVATKSESKQMKNWRDIEAALLGEWDEQFVRAPRDDFELEIPDLIKWRSCGDPECPCHNGDASTLTGADCEEPWSGPKSEWYPEPEFTDDSESVEDTPVGTLCFSAEVVGEPELFSTEDLGVMETKLIAAGYECVDNLTMDELAEAYAELCLHEYFEACSDIMGNFSRDLIKFSWKVVDNQ